MSTGARRLLDRLLDNAERGAAGVRQRAPALTATHLTDYRATKSIAAKDEVEAELRAARAAGAVVLHWDEPGEEGFIRRVDLADLAALARFLGRTLATEQVSHAEALLTPLRECYPVVDEILGRWRVLKPVRGTGPEQADAWRDAAAVIEAARTDIEVAADGAARHALPIREASYRLFKDSKRIEKLAPMLDVLLSGSVDSEVRSADDVWKELGLHREEQPVRLAGRAVVARERVSALLDWPYGAFPAATVLGVNTAVERVLTIENQTTFHSMARQQGESAVLLIYTGGMPTPAWRGMYRRLLTSMPDTTPVLHWGDVDEGGFRIASLLARDAATAGKVLQPFRMHPDDIPTSLRCPASLAKAQRMQRYASAAGWTELGEALLKAKMTVEQEGLADDASLTIPAY